MPRFSIKDLRPRFSLRTLAILVAVLCFILGSWRLTATSGVTDVRGSRGWGWSFKAVAPFIVVGDFTGENSLQTDIPIYRSYYVWFFGRVSKLSGRTTLPTTGPEPRLFPKGYYSGLDK